MIFRNVLNVVTAQVSTLHAHTSLPSATETTQNTCCRAAVTTFISSFLLVILSVSDSMVERLAVHSLSLAFSSLSRESCSLFCREEGRGGEGGTRN